MDGVIVDLAPLIAAALLCGTGPFRNSYDMARDAANLASAARAFRDISDLVFRGIVSDWDFLGEVLQPPTPLTTALTADSSVAEMEGQLDAWHEDWGGTQAQLWEAIQARIHATRAGVYWCPVSYSLRRRLADCRFVSPLEAHETYLLTSDECRDLHTYSMPRGVQSTSSCAQDEYDDDWDRDRHPSFLCDIMEGMADSDMDEALSHSDDYWDIYGGERGYWGHTEDEDYDSQYDTMYLVEDVRRVCLLKYNNPEGLKAESKRREAERKCVAAALAEEARAAQQERERRRKELAQALAARGCEIRADSRLCRCGCS
jgi:hypothetical protein